MQVIEYFFILLLMTTTIFITIKKLHSIQIPRIIKKQLKIFIQGFVVPYIILDFIQSCPRDLSVTWIANNYPAVGITTILLSFILFYISRKMTGLRFLNIKDHVQTKMKFNFIDDFREAVELLVVAANVRELSQVTKNLFNRALDIPQACTTVYVRMQNHRELYNSGVTREEGINNPIVEAALSGDQSQLVPLLDETKILMYDEIAFNEFYEPDEKNKIALDFLDRIKADIFLPVYQRNKIIAYIIIERLARPNKLYGKVERDEMVVFARYLGNVIYLLQNRSYEDLMCREKQMEDEIFRRHKENNQYRESIRSFIQDTKYREIGVLFCKLRRFVFGNKAAKKLITVDINKQAGHPLTKALKKLARDVEVYKMPQTIVMKDDEGKKLVFSCFQHLERENVIILVYYPELSDIVAQQMDLLQDPSAWDHVLYLETTHAGKLVNQVIPGEGKTFLNFKISLLKAALTNKAVLLDLPPDDLMAAVELLHSISLRDQLHVFELHGPQRVFEDAAKLFGVINLFGSQIEEEPLLKRLNKIGTLFIQNVQFLNLETQEYLAEFIRYGFYRTFKSERKYASDVRIICSTNQDLKVLVSEGTFSQALLDELQKTSLNMPSLVTLPKDELIDLANGMIDRATEGQTFKEFLDLTDQDKEKFITNRPSSLRELRIKIHYLLIQKSRKSKLCDEKHFDPSYDISDPQLLEAARLGKQALRDPKIMARLWNRFKNQNTIATLLGVNRSSVNRRCKEYGLQ